MKNLNSVMTRVAMWAGHYMLQIIAVCLALSVVAGVLGDLHILTGVPEQIADVVTIVPMFYAVINQRFHDQNTVLCKHHFYETPDDPPAAVERSRRSLLLTHLINRPRLVLPVMIGALATQMLMERALNVPPIVSSVPVMVVFVGFAILSWMASVHSRLQPWCPFCHRGGGGGRDHTPVPTDPTGSRLPSPA